MASRSLTSAAVSADAGPIEKVKMDDCINEVQKYVDDPGNAWWDSWTQNYKENVTLLNKKKEKDYRVKYVKTVREALLAENALIQFRYDRVPSWVSETKRGPCSLTNHNNFLTLVKNELKFKQEDPTREPSEAEIKAAWDEKQQTTNIPLEPINNRLQRLFKERELTEREAAVSLAAREKEVSGKEKTPEQMREEKRAKAEKQKAKEVKDAADSAMYLQQQAERDAIRAAQGKRVPKAKNMFEGGGSDSDESNYGLAGLPDLCFEENETFMTDEKNVKVEDYQKAKSAAAVFLKLMDLARGQLARLDEFTRRDAQKLLSDILKLFSKIRGTARAAVKQAILYAVYKLGFPGLTQSSQDPFLNIALFGKAGTGKTVVAKLISQVYGMSGILLYNGVVKEYTAKDLTGAYLGQSGKIMFEKLMGGLEQVVFVDEAYALVACEKDPETKKKKINQNASTYGLESIAELLKFTDEYRGKQVVIVAGYRGDMDSCFFGANEGLPRRFPVQLDLISYDTTGLMEIFMLNINPDANNMSPEVQIHLKKHVRAKFKQAVADADPSGKKTDALFKYQGGDMLNLGQAFMDLSNQQKIATKRGGLGFQGLEYAEVRALFDETLDAFVQDRKEFIENTRSPVREGRGGLETIRRILQDRSASAKPRVEGGRTRRRKKRTRHRRFFRK